MKKKIKIKVSPNQNNNPTLRIKNNLIMANKSSLMLEINTNSNQEKKMEINTKN